MTSPPTDRVVAVVNLLAGSGRAGGRTVSAIAAELGLNRSTTTAVLTALESAGWVRRGEDLGYVLGAGLIGTGEAARRSLPLPRSTGECLDALVEAVGSGVTMSLIEPGSLTVVEARHGGGRLLPGMSVGRQIQLVAPTGAAVMPWRSVAERGAWLATAPTGQRQMVIELLELVSDSGVAIWRPKEDDAALLDVLADLLDVADDQLLRPHLRQRVLAQLTKLAGRPYSRAELVSDDPLPISYLAAPVFDKHGVARFEVQLGPLRAAVPRVERDRYIAALRETSRALSAGGS
ncbi:MAG: helix-turn-helix domain-containing protein [Mycobacteriaceae bacterium]